MCISAHHAELLSANDKNHSLSETYCNYYCTVNMVDVNHLLRYGDKYILVNLLERRIKNIIH